MRSARGPWLVLLLWCVGCGAAGPDGADPAGEGTAGGEGPAWLAEEEGAFGDRVRQIVAAMRGAGLLLGPVHGRGFLTMREHHTERLDLPPSTCLTLVAIAARGVADLDATLFSPEGDVLAQDVEPDAHPTIQVCAGEEGRRVYYGLLAYDGAGAFVYMSFVGGPDSFEAAGRVLGGRPGVVSDDASREGQEARLRELTTGVARRGFRTRGEAAPVALDQDQRVRLPLETERGKCYTVAAFGVAGIEDLDLRVLDELDRELARDDGSTSDASLQLCVDRDAHLVIEVHAARGRGVAQVASFVAEAHAVGGTSGLWLGERTLARLEARPLDEAVRADLDRAREAGWRAPRRLAGGRLAAGEAVAHPLRVPAGRCTLIVATGGRGLGKLRLRLVRPDGRAVAETTSEEATASARLCPSEALALEIQLIAGRGAGDYALHASGRPLPRDLPAEVPPALRGAVLDALESGAATLRVRGGPQAIALGAEGGARVGLPTDRCARVHVVAERAVAAEVLRGERVEMRASGEATAVTSCPRERAEDAVVQVRGEPGQAAWVVVLAAE